MHSTMKQRRGSHGGLLLKFFQGWLGFQGNWIFEQTHTHTDSRQRAREEKHRWGAERGIKKSAGHTPMRQVFPVHWAGQTHLKPPTRSTHTPLWLHGFGLQSSSSEGERKNTEEDVYVQRFFKFGTPWVPSELNRFDRHTLACHSNSCLGEATATSKTF